MYDHERGGVTEARAAKIFRSGAQDNYYEQAQRSIIGSKRNVKPTAPRMCNAACTKLKYWTYWSTAPQPEGLRPYLPLH